MSDVQIAVIDQQNTEVTIAVPGVQGIQGQTGDVTVAQDGTAGTPGIRFENDTNTGIYRPGADQVAISTNGTGRLFVDANGNVNLGLSTALPTVSTGSKVLTLYPSTGAAEIVLFNPDANDSAFSHLTFGGVRTNTGATARISANRRGEIVFANNDAFNGVNTVTERLRITSDGKVGLGTSSPWSLLTVGSGGTANPAATATIHQNTYSEHRLKLTSSGFNAAGRWLGLGFGYSDNYLKSAIIAEAQDGNARTNLHFCTEGAANSTNVGLANSRMVVTYDGNVGVGTTSPTAKLAVNGAGVMARFQSGAASDGRIEFAYNTTDIGYINAAAADRLGLIARSGVDLQFGAGGSEAARIDTSGRLLVGTSSDSGGALLQVNGDRVRIATAKTPASASDTGTTGEVCWDASYIYVCTATDTWKRTAIATW